MSDTGKVSEVGRAWLPYLVLICGLVVTAAVSFSISQNLKLKHRQELETDSLQILHDVRSRMDSYVALLRGGAGLFAVNQWVTRDEFHDYVARLHVFQFYPGVQGIGFAYRVTPSSRAKLISRLDEQGITDFEIQADPQAQEMFPIVYLEPLNERNRVALGYDMYGDSIRRLAMDRARDTGKASATSRVTLVQEIDSDKQPGFLIYVPVYVTPRIPVTLQERRAKVEGFIYSPFRARDLLQGILARRTNSPVHYAVFSGKEPRRADLLFSSTEIVPEGDLQPGERMEMLDVAGHPWTIRFWPRERSMHGASRLLPAVPVAGVLLSFMLFHLIRAEAKARKKLEIAARELRASEVALRASEELHRTVSETASDAIVTIDEHSAILSVNPAVERIFGYPPAEVIGKPITFLMPERFRERHRSSLSRFVATGTRHIPWESIDLPGLHRDGHEVPLEISFGMFKREGKLFFTGVIRDVSARKKAEQAFRDSSERLRAILQTAAEGIITIDERGVIEMMNPAAERIFGYPLAEAVGQDVSILMPASDRERNDIHLEHYIRTGDAGIVASGQEIMGRRKDGTIFPLHLSISEVRLADKRLFAGFVHDITERRKTEEAVNNLNRDLETRVRERTAALRESYEQMETFTYTVAHDLRAPLRAMQGFAALLLEEYSARLDEAGADHVRRIMRASKRMDSLIQDLLAYSQLSRSDLKFENINLRAVVDAALHSLWDDLETRNAKATVEIRADTGMVVGHPATLEHIIANLVSNGVKFVARDVQPRVRLYSEPAEGGRIRLWVEDNGIGIAPDYQERIFRIFERLHGIEAYPGTGMGLALVKKGIERMRGQVGVQSEPGKGSRFWIELPAAKKILDH